MLFIGDLHITSRIQDKLLHGIRSRIARYPEEKHIVFLGDYVYHFSYDRVALLELYHLFLDLFVQGKTVYVLAGNHDRLGANFVFHEAQKAFDMLRHLQLPEAGQLHFITTPRRTNIQWQDVFFLPSMITIPDMPEGKNKNEQLSEAVNLILQKEIENAKNLLVIHHYYINATQFPGQKSRFSYRDVALSETFLDMPNIRLLSGHLHQAFSLKNYLCTGSARYTSSLENNHIKYLFRYDPASDQLTADPILINPNLTIALGDGQLATQALVNQERETIQKKSQERFTSSTWKPTISSQEPVPQSLSLTLTVDQLDYEHIDRFVDQSTLASLREVRLKKPLSGKSPSDLIEQLQVKSGDLQSFADRKSLLKSYLQQKFPTEYDRYEKLLHDLKVR